MLNINRLYDLMYKDIVTPFNLLENAKLDNYEYVKYYKDNGFLVAEMKCSLSKYDSRIFYYYFDSNNMLQEIYQENDASYRELLFDRKSEINKQLASLNRKAN